MKRKVVVLGGGTGSSTLLRGLKEFPVDLTAIVSVCDDGSSTGVLREEFNIPAVGDIRRVLVALSETEPLVMELFNYRFRTTSDLDGHTVGNLLLTASSEITGNLSDGIEALSKVFNLKGKVVPLTEDNVVLMGEMEDGSIVEGEHHITQNKNKIRKVFYKEEPIPTKEAVKALEEADLIILSMGSLFTSIIPNLICDKILEAIDRSRGKLMYVCNMVTQPGETENYKVSDHIKLLNQHLRKRKIDVVIANEGKIDETMAKRYESLEQKDPVELDKEETEGLVEKVIYDDYVTVKNNLLRHNVMKLSMHIFGYLLEVHSGNNKWS
ncbi:MAG: uridine diphosphate-N-acetylglucosamine-binding protein YvcK [Lachnospiraceae bacterium]|nr:uridine diphosphate-N-acetylglucosamine-binding protein YvcK [Lachnospiraceae bacterium]MDD7049387.1 uridine diphosphate-N-acetylglucosamine-binding protein YvcK [Lachnospiraceae bacterium]MDY3222245.1 uridine diphosphate-N-acetylglucosamine-binding protein YvcK [Lachnospiraceae bacterium]MDY4095450.1 uridine diphosphate-N-acetylglucosamine-binding protein YvcK [Lachnospiraceae bacterium]